jgi:hypothetical protein
MSLPHSLFGRHNRLSKNPRLIFQTAFLARKISMPDAIIRDIG